MFNPLTDWTSSQPGRKPSRHDTAVLIAAAVSSIVITGLIFGIIYIRHRTRNGRSEHLERELPSQADAGSLHRLLEPEAQRSQTIQNSVASRSVTEVNRLKVSPQRSTLSLSSNIGNFSTEWKAWDAGGSYLSEPTEVHPALAGNSIVLKPLPAAVTRQITHGPRKSRRV